MQQKKLTNKSNHNLGARQIQADGSIKNFYFLQEMKINLVSTPKKTILYNRRFRYEIFYYIDVCAANSGEQSPGSVQESDIIYHKVLTHLKKIPLLEDTKNLDHEGIIKRSQWDPFLLVFLLSKANLRNYGFLNKIKTVDKALIILDDHIIKLILKSSAEVEVDDDIRKMVQYCANIPILRKVFHSQQEGIDYQIPEIQDLVLNIFGAALIKLFIPGRYEELQSEGKKKKQSFSNMLRNQQQPSASFMASLAMRQLNIPIVVPSLLKKEYRFFMYMLDLISKTTIFSFPQSKKEPIKGKHIEIIQTRFQEEQEKLLVSDLIYKNFVSETLGL